MSILAEPRDLPESGLLSSFGCGKQRLLLSLGLTFWGGKITLGLKFDSIIFYVHWYSPDLAETVSFKGGIGEA